MDPAIQDNATEGADGVVEKSIPLESAKPQAAAAALTASTPADDPLLDGRTDNYLAAVAFNLTKADGFKTGLAWVELSTGNCVATSAAQGQVLDEIARLRPAEILVPEH